MSLVLSKLNIDTTLLFMKGVVRRWLRGCIPHLLPLVLACDKLWPTVSNQSMLQHCCVQIKGSAEFAKSQKVPGICCYPKLLREPSLPE
jgi:hypothetical protein